MLVGVLDSAVLTIFLDAVPKKRGPKTDVLDALLKRVDGLEAKLREKNAEQTSPTTSGEPSDSKTLDSTNTDTEEPAAKRLAADAAISPSGNPDSNMSPPLAIPK